MSKGDHLLSQRYSELHLNTHNITNILVEFSALYYCLINLVSS